MNKIFSKGSLIIYGSLTLLVLIAWGMKAIYKDVQVRATVHPLYVKLGNPIHFSDSSLNVHSGTWDFGNGDVSTQPSGDYIFNKEGQYQVRLIIDNSYSVNYVVNVKDHNTMIQKKPSKIIAPDSVFPCERILFTTNGNKDYYKWDFGEYNGKTTKEKNPSYYYSWPGTYQVKLKFPDEKDSLTHTITVLPNYNPYYESCNCNIIPDKKEILIIEYLQKISDKKGEYNTNYNKIKSLLRASDNLIVLINKTKEDRLDTYCKILRLVGKQNSTVIQDAEIEYDKNGKIKRLLITQIR
ncbi:MAG: PKD domain-containing protein [Paludibacteraceae bacterium]|nr:PKD domain-containing protein [Paludibacteraceae bacterium]